MRPVYLDGDVNLVCHLTLTKLNDYVERVALLGAHFLHYAQPHRAQRTRHLRLQA
jgi:hypothetical protein